MPYYVTRQSYWHEGGECAVEIVRAVSFDYTSPGALVEDPNLPGEGEYDDPREAAQAAAAIVRKWPAAEGRIVIANGAALQLVYPSLDDAASAVQALVWGDHEFATLPKCDRCGDLGEPRVTIYGDEYIACDTHAEDLAIELVHGTYEEDDDDE